MRYILNSRSTLYLSIILRIIPQILCNIAALRKGRWKRGKGGVLEGKEEDEGKWGRRES